MNASLNNSVSKKGVKQTRSRNTAIKEKKTTKTTSSALKESEKDEKYRSGSLSRQILLRSQESPRKPQSLDRSVNKKIVKETVSSSTPKKSIKGPSSVENSTKQLKSNVASLKQDSRKGHVVTSKSKVKNDKIKRLENPLQASKASKPKTNLQIAKSFVNSSQSRSKQSTKGSKNSKDLSHKVKENLPVSELNENNLERPRTSTIRKGPTDSLNNNDAIVDNVEGNKTLENDQPRPKSKNSVSGYSDSDRASYEDDFEDYDSDFEASDPESITETDYSEESEYVSSDQENEKQSESLESTMPANTMPELKQPVIMSKRSAEKTFLKMSDRSSLFSEKKTSAAENSSIKPSRSFINFETALTPNEETPNQNELNESSKFKSLKDELDIKQVFDSFHENYKLVGKSTSKQVSIQTENCEDETQTDEMELTNKWTQNPTNGTAGSGGDQLSMNSNVSTAFKNLFYVNSTKLSTFLQRSSNIILTLLEEDFVSSDSETSIRASDLKYCNGYYKISPPSFLSGVPVTNISSAYNLPYILTIHGDMVQLSSENSDEKGIICVWNILQSSNPEYILTSNSQPTCGTFGPDGSDIVLAGMVDGAVILWDLTDLIVKNINLESGDAVSFRSPTYNTAVALGSENHCSCIVGIQTIHKPTEKDWQSSGFDSRDRLKSFHVLTLEDMGVINIWVVVEVLNPDMSGLESDLGLAPGGKFRLVKSRCLILHSLPTLQLEQRTSIQTFDFRLIPHDCNKILVTTDAGIILHVTRHSGFAEPRYYYNESEFNSEIRCIDCSLHNSNLFLVGCSDGCIKLYDIKFVRPIFEFLQTSKGDSVILIQWSVVDPSVFCVLTSSSNIHLYNLMEDLSYPIFSNHFEDCKITWFVFNKQKKTSNVRNKRSSSNLIIAKESGDIEVHKLQDIIKQDYEKQLEFMKNL